MLHEQAAVYMAVAGTGTVMVRQPDGTAAHAELILVIPLEPRAAVATVAQACQMSAA